MHSTATQQGKIIMIFAEIDFLPLGAQFVCFIGLLEKVTSIQ